MMYYANYRRNNGESLRSDLFGINKQKLISLISKAAREGTYAGSEYSWKVWDTNGIIVGSGGGYKRHYGGIVYYNYRHLIGQSI